MLIMMTMLIQAGVNTFDSCRQRSVITELYSCHILFCSFYFCYHVSEFICIFLSLKYFQLFPTFIQQPETKRTCKVMEIEFAQKFLFPININVFKQKF